MHSDVDSCAEGEGKRGERQEDGRRDCRRGDRRLGACVCGGTANTSRFSSSLSSTSIHIHSPIGELSSLTSILTWSPFLNLPIKTPKGNTGTRNSVVFGFSSALFTRLCISLGEALASSGLESHYLSICFFALNGTAVIRKNSVDA